MTLSRSLCPCGVPVPPASSVPPSSTPAPRPGFPAQPEPPGHQNHALGKKKEPAASSPSSVGSACVTMCGFPEMTVTILAPPPLSHEHRELPARAVGTPRCHHQCPWCQSRPQTEGGQRSTSCHQPQNCALGVADAFCPDLVPDEPRAGFHLPGGPTPGPGWGPRALSSVIAAKLGPVGASSSDNE